MPTTGEVHMSYFNGNFSELNAAMEAVWDQQDATGQPCSSFTISAQGSRASVWTSDDRTAEQFRSTLRERNVDFTETPEQQVRTWLDGIAEIPR